MRLDDKCSIPSLSFELPHVRADSIVVSRQYPGLGDKAVLTRILLPHSADQSDVH